MVGLMNELEGRVNGDVLLLDTSVVTPYEETPLANILYEGIDGLEALDPVLLSLRMNRLIELSQLMQRYEVTAIPQVCTEIRRHFKILNGQHAFLTNELREVMREGDENMRYHAGVLDIINSYNLELHRFLGKLVKTSEHYAVQEQDARYAPFIDMARCFSKDLIRRTRRAKERLRHPVHLGEELETDQHLVATSFVLAYQKPVTVLTRDNGQEELARRIYEVLVRKGNSEILETGSADIPPQTINIFNMNEYDFRESEYCRQEAREFLS